LVDALIQLAMFVETAYSLTTFDPTPIGHDLIQYRWTLTLATSSSVNDVTLRQDAISQPTVGAYKQRYTRAHLPERVSVTRPVL